MINLTPMFQQYQDLKHQHPGTLLFFRLGDFYELFYADAVTGARELGITLTARHKERGAPVPMCGVPHHHAAQHIAKLVRKGYRVAICEQTEDPAKTKKLVKREVVRVITPGTAIDAQLDDTAAEAVYLAAVCGDADAYGAAFLDLSTGEFCATEARGNDAWSQIYNHLQSYSPRELLFPASLAPLIKEACAPVATTTALNSPPNNSQLNAEADLDAKKVNDPAVTSATASPAQLAQTAQTALGSAGLIALTPLDDWLWQPENCAALLREQFGVRELVGYGLDNHPQAVRAAGVCLYYARDNARSNAGAATAHLTGINYFEGHDHLILDSITVRNLELIEASGPHDAKRSTERSLLGVLDCTVTTMGARLLRGWLLRPSVRIGEIETRLGAVEALTKNEIKRDALRASLKAVADLERTTARLNMNTVTPRELQALHRSLDQVPTVRQALSDADSSLLQILYEGLDEMADVRGLIDAAISDQPPTSIGEGDVIRDGYSGELDELREISRNAKSVIARLEAQERSRSGISSLRIRYNNVFGYFIEVPKASAHRVPKHFERRQTLANAERYTTPELGEWERKALDSEVRLTQLETRLFAEVRALIAEHTKRLQATAHALALVDTLASLAEVAIRRRYVRPQLHDEDEVVIKAGRHPVIESLQQDSFVPNDLYLNNSTHRVLIITGPNMGGKSTILRQTALIAVLAQMGSFVPADKARLPIFDRLWTRVGASDDLSRGRSTFMVEMTETAQILNNATPRSLVLLDEIGRGTSTFDGLSIAWAVAEHLHDSPRHAAKTLFATHYHELTELAEKLPGAQNFRIAVAEQNGEVIFLHRLEPGRASKSYGIEVARLAGLPSSVLERARDVLKRLERYELDVFAEQAVPSDTSARRSGSSNDLASPDGQPPGSSGMTNNPQDYLTADEQALRRVAGQAGRRRLAAQSTLFEAINQSLLDELRQVQVETLSAEDARTLLCNIRERIV